MAWSPKQHFGPGEHALTYYADGTAYVTTPLRIMRRQIMAGQIVMGAHNTQTDVEFLIDHYNRTKLARFIDCAMNKLEARWKVETMLGLNQ